MSKLRAGFVTQVNHNDNMAIVKELDTYTEYIVLLDDLTKDDLKQMRIHSTVNFRRDDEFEQFVAKDTVVVNSMLRRVV